MTMFDSPPCRNTMKTKHLPLQNVFNKGHFWFVYCSGWLIHLKNSPEGNLIFISRQNWLEELKLFSKSSIIFPHYTHPSKFVILHDGKACNKSMEKS